MTRQMGFWSISERLAEISAQGDPLETLAATVDFEMFRPVLAHALGAPPRWKGGRPGFDPVLKFKMLVLQSLHGISLEQTEYLVRDRLSWMRFCGLGPEGRVPDANTLWDFREALIAADTLDALFARLDRAITATGYLPRGGQILNASLVAAPRQRNTEDEKSQIRAGKSADEVWPDKPAKARQKDVDGRWTVKYSKANVRADGTKPIDLAIPAFGYKNHISIDRKHGLIRGQTVTDAATHDGGQLRAGLVRATNTARDVWADSAYRSAENEDWLEARGMVSRIHRKKPRGRPMSKPTRRASARKSAVRSKIEHVFAQQKSRTGIAIRTIGLRRAHAAITLANMAYNMTRWRWLNGRGVLA